MLNEKLEAIDRRIEAAKESLAGLEAERSSILDTQENARKWRGKILAARHKSERVTDFQLGYIARRVTIGAVFEVLVDELAVSRPVKEEFLTQSAQRLGFFNKPLAEACCWFYDELINPPLKDEDGR